MPRPRCVQLTWSFGDEAAERCANTLAHLLRDAGVEVLTEPNAEVWRADRLLVLHDPASERGGVSEVLRRERECSALHFVESSAEARIPDGLLNPMSSSYAPLELPNTLLLDTLGEWFSVAELRRTVSTGDHRFKRVARRLKEGPVSREELIENLTGCLDAEHLWAEMFQLLAAERPELRHRVRILQMLWRYRAPSESAPTGGNDKSLASYLRLFVRDIGDQNRLGAFSGVYVPQPHMERAASTTTEYGDPDGDWGSAVRPLRRLIRLLENPTGGGGHETAELAAAGQRSWFVRDVVGALLRERYPVVLLAAPGMGKSTTMREVGLELARRQMRRRRPAIPVYVRLGRYRSELGPGVPGDVFEFIRASLPPELAALREQLPALRAQGRLIYLLDGMDEMDQNSLYSARVDALSAFGTAEFLTGNRTLFACRINNFSPRFTHKQMVLLPFNEGHIRRYLRESLLQGSIEIKEQGGEKIRYSRWSSRRLLRDLLQRTPFVESLGNPLLLFLITDFIRREGAWPRSRRELFEAWLQRVQYVARRRMVALDLKPQADDQQRQAWARIAWELTNNSSTAVSAAGLRASLGDVGGAVDDGLVAGLLTRDPARPDEIEYEHHRFQEYLCAMHLVLAEPSMDWGNLLDAPVWREVLLHAVSLAPAGSRGVVHDALNTILHQVRGVYKPKLDASEERAITQSVLLGARLWGAHSQERRIIDQEFCLSITNAARQIAARGRPAAQVRMLWACVECPELPHADILETPLLSAVPWVREQAIVVMGRERRGLGQDVGLEMSLDLARERFWRRWSVYRRAFDLDGMERWRARFLLATVIASARTLAMSSLPVGVLFVGPRMFLLRGDDALPGLVVWLGQGWGLLLAGGLAVVVPWIRPDDESEARVFALVWGLVFGLLVGLEVLWNEGLTGIVAFLMAAIVGGLVGLFIADCVQLVAWLVGAIVLSRRVGQSLQVVAKAAWRHSAYNLDFWIVSLVVGAVVVIGLGWTVLGGLSDWLNTGVLPTWGIDMTDNAFAATWGSAAWAGVGLGLNLGLLAGGLSTLSGLLLGHDVPLYHRAWMAPLFGVGVFLTVELLGVLLALLIHGWIAFEVGGWVGPVVVVLVLLAVLAVGLLAGVAAAQEAMVKRRLERLQRAVVPTQSIEPEFQVAHRILHLEPAAQGAAISCLSPAETGGDLAELQRQLDRLEEEIKPGHPAADALARKQSEVWQELDQPGGAKS